MLFSRPWSLRYLGAGASGTIWQRRIPKSRISLTAGRRLRARLIHAAFSVFHLAASAGGDARRAGARAYYVGLASDPIPGDRTGLSFAQWQLSGCALFRRWRGRLAR